MSVQEMPVFDPLLYGRQPAVATESSPSNKDSGRIALLTDCPHTKRVLSQMPKDKNRARQLYALEVECPADGKTCTPFKFCVKLSIVTINDVTLGKRRSLDVGQPARQG